MFELAMTTATEEDDAKRCTLRFSAEKKKTFATVLGTVCLALRSILCKNHPDLRLLCCHGQGQL